MILPAVDGAPPKTADLTGRERAVRNAAGVLLARGIVLSVGILLVPFMIERLGKAEYGLFQFTQTFLAYLPLLTLSAGTGLNRYLTSAIARDDPSAVARTLATGFAVLLAMAGVLGLVALVLVALLPALWASLGDDAVRVQQLLLLLTLGLVIHTVAGVFRAALFARERLGEGNLIASLSNVVRALLIVVGFHAFGASLLWIGVATVLGIVAETSVAAVVGRRVLPGFSIAWKQRDANAGRELLSFSALATFGGLCNALLLSSDNFLIQGLFGANGPERIAVYSVAAMWDPLIRGVMMQLTGIVVPRMTQLAARGDERSLRELAVLSVRYATGLVVAPCVLLFVFADRFLAVWLGGSLGPEDLATAATILRWVLVTVFLQMSMNTTYGVFYARGRLVAPVVVAGIVAMAKIGLSLGLAGPGGLGLAGIAMGTVVAVGASQMLVRPWLLWREIALTPGRLVAAGLAPGIAAGGLLAVAAVGVDLALPGDAGLLPLGASAAALGVLYAGLAWGLVVLPEDRGRVLDALRNTARN